MKIKWTNIRIGLRTVKTAVAVLISMALVNSYGASTSKLIFAMLGAMAAVQPTFKDSLDSCYAQIVGVLFGAAASIVLALLPVPPLDGYHVVNDLLLKKSLFAPEKVMRAGQALLLILMFTGWLDKGLNWAVGGLFDAVGHLALAIAGY